MKAEFEKLRDCMADFERVLDVAQEDEDCKQNKIRFAANKGCADGYDRGYAAGKKFMVEEFEKLLGKKFAEIKEIGGKL